MASKLSPGAYLRCVSGGVETRNASDIIGHVVSTTDYRTLGYLLGGRRQRARSTTAATQANSTITRFS